MRLSTLDECHTVTDTHVVYFYLKELVMKKNTNVAAISEELQALQRQRAWHLKSRNMIANRLQATVAGTIGYHGGMEDDERHKMFAEAGVVIKQIVKGEVSSAIEPLVKTTMVAVSGFEDMKKALEKSMVKLAKQLPVLSWVEDIDQRGFGVLMMAVVIGETGDLANYENPAKVWRRLGCAPYTKDGETCMGATWRGRQDSGNGTTKLRKLDWTEFGYSPRRRSIAYLIGEGLIKLNQDGPYRKRWVEAKIRAYETHPDWKWKDCDKCKGGIEIPCKTCGSLGKTCGHAHNHGMLLATKLLLKNLWIEWNGRPPMPEQNW